MLHGKFSCGLPRNHGPGLTMGPIDLTWILPQTN